MSRIRAIINKINSRPYNCNVKYEELKMYLMYYGFKEIRISGSHHIFISLNGDELVIPSHNNVVLPIYVKKASDLVNKKELKYEEN